MFYLCWRFLFSFFWLSSSFPFTLPLCFFSFIFHFHITPQHSLVSQALFFLSNIVQTQYVFNVVYQNHYIVFADMYANDACRYLYGLHCCSQQCPHYAIVGVPHSCSFWCGGVLPTNQNWLSYNEICKVLIFLQNTDMYVLCRNLNLYCLYLLCLWYWIC